MFNDSACELAGVCGGCTYQGVPYEEQLEIKNNTVLSFLSEHDLMPSEYRPLRATGITTGYRNKMEYTFGDEIKGGDMTLGLHKQGSYMSVVNTEKCLLVPDPFNRIRSAVYEWAQKSGHGFHHKRSHKGFLRSLVLRYGERTGEILVNLVTTSEETLDEASFVDAIMSSVTKQSNEKPQCSRFISSSPRDFSAICDRDDANLREPIGFSPQDTEHCSIQITGILHTINDRRSDVVACDSYKTLYGRDHYFEELMGLTFRVGAFSFFQTNTSAVESMLSEALAMIPDNKKSATGITGVAGARTLYDVYCGTGTISLALSGRADKVIGIELVEDSVISARENAERNGITNAEFICGDAFDVMSTLPPPDMIVVDPPRMGLHPKALKRILDYDLPAILYISCNPKTFSENAAVLKSAGYGISVLGAYDNFPFTRHIELAALIIK